MRLLSASLIGVGILLRNGHAAEARPTSLSSVKGHMACCAAIMMEDGVGTFTADGRSALPSLCHLYGCPIMGVQADCSRGISSACINPSSNPEESSNTDPVAIQPLSKDDREMETAHENRSTGGVEVPPTLDEEVMVTGDIPAATKIGGTTRETRSKGVVLSPQPSTVKLLPSPTPTPPQPLRSSKEKVAPPEKIIALLPQPAILKLLPPPPPPLPPSTREEKEAASEKNLPLCPQPSLLEVMQQTSPLKSALYNVEAEREKEAKAYSSEKPADSVDLASEAVISQFGGGTFAVVVCWLHLQIIVAAVGIIIACFSFWCSISNQGVAAAAAAARDDELDAARKDLAASEAKIASLKRDSQKCNELRERHLTALVEAEKEITSLRLELATAKAAAGSAEASDVTKKAVQSRDNLVCATNGQPTTEIKTEIKATGGGSGSGKRQLSTDAAAVAGEGTRTATSSEGRSMAQVRSDPQDEDIFLLSPKQPAETRPSTFDTAKAAGGDVDVNSDTESTSASEEEEHLISAEQALVHDLQGGKDNAYQAKLRSDAEASEKAVLALLASEEQINLKASEGGRKEEAGSDDTTEQWTTVQGRKKGRKFSKRKAKTKA